MSGTPGQETMEPTLSNFRYTKLNRTDGANSQETQVKIHKMQHLEGSGTPVLYLGRKVLEG